MRPLGCTAIFCLNLYFLSIQKLCRVMFDLLNDLTHDIE